MNVRVRFAPSPTGFLHIGGLRSALYNYLFAKKMGGTFLLRIEDTDRERFVEGGTEALINIFPRVGLDYDEGPEKEGKCGPYIQSMRLEIYKKYADQLLADGHAYYCFCSSEELESQRKEQTALKLPTKYNRHCLTLTKEEVEKKLSLNEPHIVRMHIPDGETTFTDMIRGDITIKNEQLDDQVLMKSDGFPTYHLANTVDDHLMEISHVIRGEEWISSAPKHVLLYKMFGWTAPQFAHLPLLLNADHSKLSKRQGDVAVEDYLNKGFLPEALINFVALMGYNPKGDQELYALKELCELFEISKVNPSGAVVNFEKLNWMNEIYLRKKSGEELVALCEPFMQAAGKSVEKGLFAKILEVEKERMTTLADVVDKVELYTSQAAYDPAMLVWKKADAIDAKANLTMVLEYLQGIDEADFAVAKLEEKVKAFIAERGLQNGNVLWPMRVALSGQSQSPSPFQLAWALGKAETLERIEAAIEKLT